MEKYAAFIRGINVGGKNSVSMTELSKVLLEKGFSDVRTYINSGNIIFLSQFSSTEAASIIRDVIKSKFQIFPEVIIKSPSEIERILKVDPYSSWEDDPSKKIVVLLKEKIPPEKINEFKDLPQTEENFYVMDDLIFIYYYNGAGRSKFTLSLIERKLGIIGTARNWNTIKKIKEFLSTTSQ